MATHSIPSVQLCLNNVSENQLPPLQCHFMIFSCIFTFGLLLAVCLAGLHFTSQFQPSHGNPSAWDTSAGIPRAGPAQLRCQTDLS